MIAKLIAWGENREQAVKLMLSALDEFRVEGIKTTIPLQRAVVAHRTFREAEVTTRWLESEFLPSWNKAAARRQIISAASNSAQARAIGAMDASD